MEFDPYSEDYFNGAYETYRWMRDEAPVYRNERLTFWALSRYEDVLDAFRDARTFISGRGVLLDQLNTPGFQAGENLPGFFISYDGREHTRLRNLAVASFTPKGVVALEHPVRRAARKYLDSLGDRPEFDFVEDFAMRFGAEVLHDLVGIPDADREFVLATALDFDSAGDEGEPAVLFNDRHVQGMIKMLEYVNNLVQEKRKHPADDLMTRMLHTRVVDENGVEQMMTDAEMCGYMLLMLVAGVETVMKMMAAGIVAFHHNPDQWRKILDDPTKIPAAIEEIGRYDPPVHYIGRKSSRDVTYYGVTIPADSNFLLVTGAANRDNRVFENPDAFDIDRTMTKKPLTFGFGPHLCLGAHLARLETRVALEEIRTRWPHFEIDESRLVRARSFNSCGFRSVPFVVSAPARVR